MSGITGTQAELLFTMPTAVTKNTFTTQAAITGVLNTNVIPAYPGGWLLNDNPNPVGRGLWLHARGTIATTSAATIALALGFDTTANTIANSISVMSATAPVASITAGFTFDAYYTCTAFATTQATFEVDGTWCMDGSASGGAGVSTGLRTSFSGTISNFNPANTAFIELFGTWSASAAGNTTTFKQMFLWGLN